MSAATTEPPKVCPSCGSKALRPHCPPPSRCRWRRCPACKAVTGFTHGELRTVK